MQQYSDSVLYFKYQIFGLLQISNIWCTWFFFFCYKRHFWALDLICIPLTLCSTLHIKSWGFCPLNQILGFCPFNQILLFCPPKFWEPHISPVVELICWQLNCWQSLPKQLDPFFAFYQMELCCCHLTSVPQYISLPNWNDLKNLGTCHTYFSF